MMYDIYNNIAAINLNELLKMTSESNNYKTRSTSNQCFYVKNIKNE